MYSFTFASTFIFSINCLKSCKCGKQIISVTNQRQFSMLQKLNEQIIDKQYNVCLCVRVCASVCL